MPLFLLMSLFMKLVCKRGDKECLKIWNKYSKDILHLEDDFEYEADVEAYV